MNKYFFSLVSAFVLVWLMVFLQACTDETPRNPYSNFKQTPFVLPIPFGFPRPLLPADNPLTAEGIELGRRLFYEKRLSRTNTLSCGGCHAQNLAFTDQKRFSVGVDGLAGTRQSMPLFNLAWTGRLGFFWDNRAKTLRELALIPIQDPIEMHETLPKMGEKLQNDANYQAMFGKAFNSSEVNSERVGLALEQFLLSIVSANSRFDKAQRGEQPLTAQEQRGLSIFRGEFRQGGQTRGADCFHCHGNILFTTNAITNNGLDSVFLDLGRGGITRNAFDNGKFRVPSLRNIALTAPYMHDGRHTTLMQTVEHYNAGIKNSPTLDPTMKALGSTLDLSQQDKLDLIAFLNTLTDNEFLDNPAYKEPQ